MTVKPSVLPWADQPIALIASPPNYKAPNIHSAIFLAKGMADVHNGFYRSLNSILLQGPYVQDSTSPDYKQKDVEDLLFYINTWVRGLEHHHNMEETVAFPKIQAIAQEPDVMAHAVEQHEAFTPGVEKLLDYTNVTKPADWRWNDMKLIIDSFLDPLVNHMNDEVCQILALETCTDSAQLTKVWAEVEEAAKSSGGIGMFYDIFCLIYGATDSTYEQGAGADFPPFPHVVRHVTQYWFSWRGPTRGGAWRFNPCDFYGQPRELLFLPKDPVAKI